MAQVIAYAPHMSPDDLVHAACPPTARLGSAFYFKPETEYPLVEAPQPQYTVQMWARLGYAPPAQPAPRRGLDAHVMKV